MPRLRLRYRSGSVPAIPRGTTVTHISASMAGVSLSPVGINQIDGTVVGFIVGSLDAITLSPVGIASVSGNVYPDIDGTLADIALSPVVIAAVSGAVQSNIAGSVAQLNLSGAFDIPAVWGTVAESGGFTQYTRISPMGIPLGR